ncbi:MAG: glycosyl hydrolase 108 family protein [Pseudomonadota bacterium]
MMAEFEPAYYRLMGFEGWDKTTDDPDDPGGKTSYGISARSYPEFDGTAESAKGITFRDFWLKNKLDAINDQELANKMLIMFFLRPVSKKRFQEACNLFGAKLITDGVIGKKTVDFVNSFRHPKAIAAGFEILLGEDLIAIGNGKFLAGWLIRNDES